MDTEKRAENQAEWYQFWMKQSQAFFNSAEKDLTDLFAKGLAVKPEDHLKLINGWLDTLKNQWDFSQTWTHAAIPNHSWNEQPIYWQTISKMCNEASDLMVKEWIRRSRENKPVQNIRELYELWLTCCQEIHEKAMLSKDYHDSYAEFINAAFKFWKSYMR